MSATLQAVRASIRTLPDDEKSRLVDEILSELDRPDPAMDALWLAEVRERREDYRQKRTATVSYTDVLRNLRRS